MSKISAFYVEQCLKKHITYRQMDRHTQTHRRHASSDISGISKLQNVNFRHNLRFGFFAIQYLSIDEEIKRSFSDLIVYYLD